MSVIFQSLTPKKLRAAKRSHIPSMMSPSGPNAIRISNFSLIGSATITLKDISERKFALQKVGLSFYLDSMTVFYHASGLSAGAIPFTDIRTDLL